MKQSRPQHGVQWCSNAQQENDDTFRVKLRTDMLQVVRDQHDMLQSWACQWERKSMQQIDELSKTIGELREDMKTLKETRNEKQTGGFTGFGANRLADYSLLEKFSQDVPGFELEGMKQPHSRSSEDGGRLASVPREPDAAEANAGKDSSQLVQTRIAHQAQNFALCVSEAAELAEEVPAVFYWDAMGEHFPVLKNSPIYRRIGSFVLWWYTAREPPRTGLLADIKEHAAFEALCMTVILTNTLCIFISANYGMQNLTDQDTSIIKVVNTVFTAFYCCELVLKLMVHRGYFFINKEKAWNMFDFALVFGGLLEVMMGVIDNPAMLNPGFMRCMRLLKLAKILRVVRVMRFFDELRLMLKCVVGSFLSLFWAFVMLLCFNLLFAIYFVQQVTSYIIDEGDAVVSEPLPGHDMSYKEEAIELYGSVQIAMLSLFKGISGGNDWDLYFPVIEKTGWFNAGVFIFYILLVWISLTNIITSIFVEKALDFAKPGLEDQILDKHGNDHQTALDLKELFRNHDKDHSDTISWEEFQECLSDRRLTDYMCFRGLEVKDTEAFFKMLSSMSPAGEVDLKTIIGGCLKLRGAASEVDMLSLSFKMQHMHVEQARMHEEQARLQGMMTEVRQLILMAVGRGEPTAASSS